MTYMYLLRRSQGTSVTDRQTDRRQPWQGVFRTVARGFDIEGFSYRGSVVCTVLSPDGSRRLE